MTGWRYPTEAGGRDLRLDFLRGLCLFKMVFDHLLWTPLHGYRQWIGYVSAAEGFFLISGVVVGLVYRRRLARDGLAAATRALWRRAGTLYLANLVLVVVLAVLETRGILDRHGFEKIWGEDGFRWWQLLHFDQPYYLHVLPRYVVYLALTPAALWLLARRRIHWLLLASLAVWYVNWRLNGVLQLPFLEPGRPAFQIAAWQLLFFGGLALGWHRERLARNLRAVPWGFTLVLAALGAIAFAAARLGIEADVLELSSSDRFRYFGRARLGPLRLVNLAFVAVLFYLLTDRLWRPLARAAGRVLIPFGQHSLYVFLMHVVVIYGNEILGIYRMPPFRASPWAHLALDVVMLALLWWMVKRRFLFRLLPR